MCAVRQRSAEISWVKALVHRWSGRPEVALRHAMAAAEEYSALNQLSSLGRIATVVADTALDLVESFGASAMPQTMSLPQQLYAALAKPYVVLAMDTLQKKGDDPIGVMLATLTQARLERITHQDTERLAKIAEVITFALKQANPEILSMAQTTLGDEFRACGETEQSLVCYRLALDTLRATEYPVIGIWAKRRLLQAAEGQPA